MQQQTAVNTVALGATTFPPVAASGFAFAQPRAAPWPEFLAGQPGHPVQVLIVDNAAQVRSIVGPQLLADPRTLIVGQADTLREGRRLVRRHAFDVLLAGARLADGAGLDLIAPARAARDVQVIVVGPEDDEPLAMRALELGAAGYLGPNSWFANFVDAVLQVANGGVALSPTIARKLLGRLIDPAGASPLIEAEACRLSMREREIVRLISSGCTSAAIACRLSISELTVDTHVRNIYRKLRVRTRAQAVTRASEWKLL